MSALVNEFRIDNQLHCAGNNRLPNRKEPSFLINQIASARSSREILIRYKALILGLFGANLGRTGGGRLGAFVPTFACAQGAQD